MITRHTVICAVYSKHCKLHCLPIVSKYSMSEDMRGDPWNELADHLAKTEATCGHKLRRQSIDLRKWKPVFPYLWMLFESRAGLPQFRGNCFDVHPPRLPEAKPADRQASSNGSRIIRHHMALSLATCNVGSLLSALTAMVASLLICVHK